MGPVDPHVDLGDYRRLDQPEGLNAEKEQMPEKQTLSARFVGDFLNKRGITQGNFDKNFTLATAVDLTFEDGKKAKGSAEMFDKLSKAKTFLDQRKMGDLLENTNEAAALSNIHRALEKSGDLKWEADILRAYYTYRAVRMYCDRMFKIHEQFSESRDKEKTKIDKSVKDDFAEAFDGMKKNFGSMDAKEKMLVVVGGLFGGAMLLNSDNPRIDGVRETIWTAMKIGGYAWLGNTICKVLTGKTAIDHISDMGKSSTENEAFWTKTFKTGPEQAENLRKSTIYLGDKDFMRLAEDYKKARDSGKTPLEMSVPSVSSKDMNGQQIYAALDAFFNKDANYAVDKLIAKYAQMKPPATWREVVGTEMIDDGSLEISGSLISRTADKAVGTVERVYNWGAPKVGAAYDYVASADIAGGAARVAKGGGRLVGGAARGLFYGIGGAATGAYEAARGISSSPDSKSRLATDVSEAAKGAFEWAKDLYRKNFGKEGTDEQVKAWAPTALKVWDESRSGDLEKFIRENNAYPQTADGYAEAIRGGTSERVNDADVKFVIRGNDMFVVANSHIQGEVIGNEQGILNAGKKSDAAAREFLKKRYPAVADKIDTFIEFSQGVYTVNDASYKVFVRMPLPGTIEFNQRMNGRWSPKEMKGDKDLNIFSEGNKFEYSKLQPWEQNNLRLRFFLDSSQTPELEAVCDKYTRLYQDKGLPINVVRKQFMEDENDRKEVLKQLKIETKLFANHGRLEAHESAITSLEKDAAAKILGSDDNKKAFEERMRKDLGAMVRLALLGDHESMLAYSYDPSSQETTKIHTAENLLKVYKDQLDKKAKEQNGG